MKKSDGHTRAIQPATDLEKGVVVRLPNPDGSIAPFSDTIILGFEGDYVKLARPYGFAGNSAPSVWAEVYTVPIHTFTERFVVVTHASGKAYKHGR